MRPGQRKPDAVLRAGVETGKVRLAALNGALEVVAVGVLTQNGEVVLVHVGAQAQRQGVGGDVEGLQRLYLDKVVVQPVAEIGKLIQGDGCE